MTMRLKRGWPALLLAVAMSLAGGRPLSAEEVRQASYEGTLGSQRIGLILQMAGPQVASSRYYYLRHLADIPLTGERRDGVFVLRETGAAMTLHFVGNGSEHGEPLDFDNSIGLEGEWSDGKRSLPVKLRGGGLFAAPPPGHWYQSITDQTDDVFEARSRGFREAVLKGDRAQAARYVHFPLRVNHGAGKHEQLSDASQLAAQWTRIFLPGYVARIEQASPHAMSIVQGYAMLGDGLVFFSDRGAEVINAP